MKFAVNYSKPARKFLKTGQIHFDLYKLPCWPDVVEKTAPEYPGYIHFPLKVTGGDGTIRDTETKAPVDFARIEHFLTQTRTPLVNVHLTPNPKYHPDLAPDDLSDSAAATITERMCQDVSTLVHHFGAQNVIAENDAGGPDVIAAALLPQVIHTVIEQTGCGFLFDFSHARLAARLLNMDVKTYIAQLPTNRIREVHLTGIQRIDAAWQKRMLASGLMDEKKLERYRDRDMDHLPFTQADWEFTAWAFEQIHSGAWAKPWVASCEYGGLGGFFESTLDEKVILEQFPRLAKLVKNQND